MSNTTARRLFQLVEPIAVVTYLTPEPTEAAMALGAGTMWDAYFAPGPRVPCVHQVRDEWLAPRVDCRCDPGWWTCNGLGCGRVESSVVGPSCGRVGVHRGCRDLVHNG